MISKNKRTRKDKIINPDMDPEHKNKIRVYLNGTESYPHTFYIDEIRKILEMYNYEFQYMHKFNVTISHPYNIQLIICVLFGLEDWVDLLKSKQVDFLKVPLPLKDTDFTSAMNVLKKLDYQNVEYKKDIYCRYACTRDSLDEIVEIFNLVDNDYGYLSTDLRHRKHPFRVVSGFLICGKNTTKINTLFEFLILTEKYSLAKQVEEVIEMNENVYFTKSYNYYLKILSPTTKSAANV